MNFWHNDKELSIGIDLDEEPEDLDLTVDRLGNSIIAYAIDAMKTAFTQERAPDGTPWAPIRETTARRKGHHIIGIETGEMYAAIDDGTIVVDRRAASWTYPQGETRGRALGFHNGRAGKQPPRRFVGWTDNAKTSAQLLIEAAALPLARALD